MIAICVGHSRSGDRGAASVGNISEWDFNQPIAYRVAAILNAAGHPAKVVDVYDGNGYGAAMSWLGRHLTKMGATLAIELHFNAAGPTAHGYEYLHWATSKNGKRLAQCLLDAQAARFPASRNRGLKPNTSADRGSGFLKQTPCPAVICEPFFGSNASEWRAYDATTETLAQSYAAGITTYIGD